MSSRQVVYAQKRRSTRIDKALTLAVQGVGALRAPYQEHVTTITISCHGCNYRSKHEVIQGDVVFLDLKQMAEGQFDCSSRARVKWVQKLQTKDHAFEVAVELETPGNIWGIAPPAEDWFPIQDAKIIEPSNPGRELRVVNRAEPQTAAIATGAATPATHLGGNETPASLSPLLAQLMIGLSEQIQVMASGAITAALAREKSRLVDEFRAQLQGEAARAIERMQRNMEVSRSESVERFVSRLREQITPLLEETKNTLQKLAASEVTFKDGSQTIYTQFLTQLEGDVNGALVKVRDELDKNSASIVEETTGKLLALSEGCEKGAVDNLRSLEASSADSARKSLEERASEISRHFATQLESLTRNYLASISESIVDIPKKITIHPSDS